MKINYKPAPSKRNPPRQWEIWLADTPFGPDKKKRCSVLVRKRNGQDFVVMEVTSSTGGFGALIPISDFLKAGMDRPSYVKATATANLKADAFVQKIGMLDEQDMKKIMSASSV